MCSFRASEILGMHSLIVVFLYVSVYNEGAADIRNPKL